MAYGTKWVPAKGDQCIAEAERKAGTSNLGYLYRFDDMIYAAPLDEYDEPIPGGGTFQVELTAYPISAKTEKGFWIGSGMVKRKFVLMTANKRFALPTVEEAIESFVARKTRQANIHQARANKAIRAIEMLKGDALDAAYA